MKSYQARILGFAVLLVLTGNEQTNAKVPEVLCGNVGCEYLVDNFSGTYPDERERIHWECYDRISTASIACAFIRGDKIRTYSDVYRKKNGPLKYPVGQSSDGNQAFCAALHSRMLSLREDAHRAELSFLQTDESDSGCEMIPTVTKLLRLRRAVYEAAVDYKNAVEWR